MKPTDDGGQLLSEWKCSFHGDTARGAAETAVILDKRLVEVERKIHVLGVAPGEGSGADAEDRHMAKKTTARGKPAPAFVTRQELLDELVLSNRAGGQEMEAVRETLNLLGERVNVLDSRVTGEIKVLRERLKAGEKRAEPIGGIEDRLKLVAVELSKLHYANSELEKKLHGTTIAAMERIEQLEEQTGKEQAPEPEELDPWIVLWRDNSTPLSAPPLAFSCRAVDGDHAEDKFRKVHPGGTPLYTTMAGVLEEAIKDWILHEQQEEQTGELDSHYSNELEALRERLRVVEQRSNDATHGMFALSDRIRKVESDRDVAIAEAVLKIGELDSKLVQALERIEELEGKADG